MASEANVKLVCDLECPGQPPDAGGLALTFLSLLHLFCCCISRRDIDVLTEYMYFGQWRCSHFYDADCLKNCDYRYTFYLNCFISCIWCVIIYCTTHYFSASFRHNNVLIDTVWNLGFFESNKCVFN